MRTVLRGLWILGALGTASSAVVSCHAPCSDTDSCGTYIPPSGGGNEAGSAGNAGTASSSAGTSGKGGASGGNAGSLGAGAAGESEAGTAGGDTPCDTSQSPALQACLVDNEHAIFVAPTGKDSAPGTKNAPLASLSKAVEIAGSKLILVCDDTYDEHVAIAAPARIYGGFKCSNWSSEDGAPLFKPSSAGPALKIDSVSDTLTLTSIDFEVGDATENGQTALTAIVNASPSVTFDTVSFKAGKGKAGDSGSLTEFQFPDPNSLNGNEETSAGVGGGEHVCMCQEGLQTVGGGGGPPSSSGQNGADGLPSLGAGLAGDHTKPCSSGGGGGDGSDAPAPIHGVGAAAVGAATAAGWQPMSGQDGATGSPGQGGGGGSSRNALGHGGGGGCGGCGGNGATAGTGGGGSIALLLINSPVVLNGSTLTTSDAGDGGSGVPGQTGQQDRGSGGNSLSSLNSCFGGNGGKGGDGGASGGGAGGVSVGIVWKGADAPTLTDTTTTTGKAGAAGIGGVPGTNDGIAGLKRDLLQAL